MPETWEALAVALLAIVPGFIATSMWARARTWRGPSGDLRTVLQSIALSAAVQVAISPLTIWWILPIGSDPTQPHHPVRIAIWFFLAVLALPISLGIGIARLSDAIFFKIRQEADPKKLPRYLRLVVAVLRGSPMPSAWDWLFTDQLPDGRFVQVRFDDGACIGGVFSKGGQAFTSPEVQGLYLAQEWVLDQDYNFQEPVPDSGGILIPSAASVRWVRILRSSDETKPKDKEVGDGTVDQGDVERDATGAH